MADLKDVIEIDWKAPSIRKMKDYVKTLGAEKKKEFAQFCVEKKDDKTVINKSKAKTWLADNCADDDNLKWKNKPKNTNGLSATDEIASWLN